MTTNNDPVRFWDQNSVRERRRPFAAQVLTARSIGLAAHVPPSRRFRAGFARPALISPRAPCAPVFCLAVANDRRGSPARERPSCHRSAGRRDLHHTGSGPPRTVVRASPRRRSLAHRPSPSARNRGRLPSAATGAGSRSIRQIAVASSARPASAHTAHRSRRSLRTRRRPARRRGSCRPGARTS